MVDTASGIEKWEMANWIGKACRLGRSTTVVVSGEMREGMPSGEVQGGGVR
jgi:hypothetical protein